MVRRGGTSLVGVFGQDSLDAPFEELQHGVIEDAIEHRSAAVLDLLDGVGCRSLDRIAVTGHRSFSRSASSLRMRMVPISSTFPIAAMLLIDSGKS